jgi:nucleoside-diphosphate-sugar epimerase
MTRVLVTGADGEIGRAVSHALVRAGYEVSALSLGFGSQHPADRLFVGDTTSVADVAAALNDVDAVAHFAAIPHPSLGTPYEVFRVNTDSTFNVLEQAGQRGVRRAVIASSINALGYPNNPHGTWPPSFPLDEHTPADIADAYSLSKSVDEQTAAYAHRRHGIDVVALRFPLVKWPSVLRDVAQEIARDPAAMAREGWAYLTMGDAVRAVLRGLEAPTDGVLVAGLSAADTLLGGTTQELADRYTPGVPITRPVADTGALIDTTTAERALGFHPLESLHDGTAVAQSDPETPLRNLR